MYPYEVSGMISSELVHVGMYDHIEVKIQYPSSDRQGGIKHVNFVPPSSSIVGIWLIYFSYSGDIVLVVSETSKFIRHSEMP
jgi:hypothetical protein